MKEPKTRVIPLFEKVGVIDIFVRYSRKNILWGYRDYNSLVYFAARPLAYAPEDLDVIQENGWVWSGDAWRLTLGSPAPPKTHLSNPFVAATEA